MYFDLIEGEWVYGYVRVEIGDEFSKWVKFVFIIWIGESVFVL